MKPEFSELYYAFSKTTSIRLIHENMLKKTGFSSPQYEAHVASCSAAKKLRHEKNKIVHCVAGIVRLIVTLLYYSITFH